MEMVFVSLTKAPVLRWWAQPKTLRSFGQGWAELSLETSHGTHWENPARNLPPPKVDKDLFCSLSDTSVASALLALSSWSLDSPALSHLCIWAPGIAQKAEGEGKSLHASRIETKLSISHSVALPWADWGALGLFYWGPCSQTKPRTGALGAACESSAWLKGFVPSVSLQRRNPSTDPFQEHLMHALWLERVGEVKNNLWRRHSNEQLSFLSIDFLQQDSPCV